MNFLVKGIGSGIGLASEAIAHHKEKKTLEKQRTTSPNPQARSTSPYPPEEPSAGNDENDSDESDDFEGDEKEWALDAAAGELEAPPPPYGELSDVPPQPVDEMVSSFMENHPPPRHAQPFTPLPCPVILPQRRPKDKKRGFIRAYAPVLGECAGIDQKTFLDFLEDFHKSSQVRITNYCLGHGISLTHSYPRPLRYLTSSIWAP
jgi:hypothetical protein